MDTNKAMTHGSRYSSTAQATALISQGRAENKAAKEILTDLDALYEQQSDFYKLATSWEGQTLSSPESYTKLVAMTADYVNRYV